MVEGYLRKWVNIVHGWKPRYFIIHNGLLFICDHKGGKRKGTVALKISTISTTPEDPLRMIIFTGTNEIHIKAEDAKDMKKWYQALIEAQEDTINREDMQGYQQEKEIESYEKRLSPQTKKSMSKSSNLDTLKEKLAELWVHQAEFDETLSLVAPKVKSIPHLSENMSKLEQIGRDLKYNVTECVNMIEAEKKRMLSLAYQFESANASGGADVNKRLDFGANNYGRNLEENDDSNDTEFHSFESDDDDEEEEEAKVFEGFERPTSRQPSHAHGRDLEPIHLGSALSPTKSSVQLNPHVKHLITTNPVYLETPISKEPKRDKLPFVLDPNQKFNVWAVAKDLIGKDLSRFAVPVWLNEPLSMLQKLCEQIEYHNLLDIGAQKEDSCMRMAYVMAFAFAYNASTTGRLKKPFNPILGETYEFVDGGVKFVSEQVSHHPPISAGYAEGNHFEWWGDAQIKTAFKGTSLEVRATGSCHAVLKPHGDHFIYKRPTTGVHNIIIGQMYVDNYGDMPFSNSKTGDTGQLTLKKRGWGDKGAYEAEGWIKNKAGTIKYHLAGKWNSHLTLIDAVTKQETRIWNRTPLSEQAHLYYNFSTFAMQLNHLHEDLVPRLAATDCRFRPDQRALEHGFYDLARDEKFRLEEKQRARRKELQAKGETHKARWFEEIKDSVTGEKEYKYLGGYFECREKKNYGEVLNLFD